MAKYDLTAQRLRELLHYDQETGVFVWVKQTSFRSPVGKIAGATQKIGYRIIGIERTRYYAHRLAWLYVTGNWPTQHIDHIDGNKSNNAFCNLRDVSPTVNLQNLRKASKGNKSSGLMGVERKRTFWAASIRVKGRSVKLGVFQTPEKAHAAYIDAKRRLHEGCTI